MGYSDQYGNFYSEKMEVVNLRFNLVIMFKYLYKRNKKLRERNATDKVEGKNY